MDCMHVSLPDVKTPQDHSNRLTFKEIQEVGRIYISVNVWVDTVLV